MSHLTPDDEALLRQARLGLEPTGADRVRIKRKIATRLVLGAAGAALAASTSTAEASVAAATGVATAAKLLGGLLVVGGLVSTGALVLRGSHQHRAMATTRAGVVVTAPASAGGPEAPAALLRAAPSATPAPATPVPPAPPAAPAAMPAARRAVTRAQIPSAASASPERSESESAPLSGPTTVAAETELLREADASLRAGNGARALTLLNEHAARFPSGILVEEREAERVAVLCALGRSAEARESATAFLRDHARSPLSVRVRGSCAAP